MSDKETKNTQNSAEEKGKEEEQDQQQPQEQQEQPQEEQEEIESTEEEINISATDDTEDTGQTAVGMNSSDETEELPEDVKKKLEKKKQEKGKKEKQSKKKVKKKKTKEKVESGCAYIKASYNNTIVTLADEEGNVISWASAGVAGFKGPKKSTPYAAQIITKIACMKAKEDYGLKNVKAFVRGAGIGRDAAVRALNSNGLHVSVIKDVTPIPHNGCRPPKPRRV